MRHPWPLLVLAAVLGCGSESDDSVSPRVNRFAFRDPQGDTLASPFASAQAHDVLDFEAVPRGDTLHVSVRFAQLVQPNSTGADNAVLGIFDIDIDDDPATGFDAVADAFGATSRIGAEWSLFLEDSSVARGDRRVALVNLATREISWIPARFEGTTVTARVPIAMLGAQPAARMRLVGVVGSIERASDIVPNEGSVLVAMP
jgi:hypothetical protein